MRFSGRIIGIAIEVHRHLGPGLLESAYEAYLCFDPTEAGIAFARQVPLPMTYKGARLDCGYRMGLVVDDGTVVEIKAVEHVMRIHKAQLPTYLRLSGCRAGLPMSFDSYQATK
jgi:GxxExxY protein